MNRLTRVSLVVLFALTPSLTWTQLTARPSPRAPRRPASRNTVQQIEAMAPRLARHAAIVFSGKVIAVENVAADSRAHLPSVRITFAVDRAYRGTFAGNHFQMLEWPGLWQLGERYQPGERYLMFLYAPNANGLTSPVGGNRGRFPIAADGSIAINVAQLQAFADPKALPSPAEPIAPVFKHFGPNRGMPNVLPRPLPE